MLLFIVVAVGLYLLYTKPSAVPGHRASTAQRPVSYTAIPGTPTVAEADAGVVGGENDVPGTPADAATAADGQNAEPEAQE